MKKLTVLGFFLLTFACTSFGQFKFGAGVSFEVADYIGVTGKAHYTVNEEFAGQASFSYFFEDFTIWAIDLDVHYNGFEIGDLEGFRLTPFAGLQIGSIEILGFSDTEIGLNVGISGTLPLTESLDLWIEPKFTFGGLEGFFISGGVYF